MVLFFAALDVDIQFNFSTRGTELLTLLSDGRIETGNCAYEPIPALLVLLLLGLRTTAKLKTHCVALFVVSFPWKTASFFM